MPYTDPTFEQRRAQLLKGTPQSKSVSTGGFAPPQSTGGFLDQTFEARRKQIYSTPAPKPISTTPIAQTKPAPQPNFLQQTQQNVSKFGGSVLSGLGEFKDEAVKKIQGFFTPKGGEPRPITLPEQKISIPDFTPEQQKKIATLKVGQKIPGFDLDLPKEKSSSAQLTPEAKLAASKMTAGNVIDNIFNKPAEFLLNNTGFVGEGIKQKASELYNSPIETLTPAGNFLKTIEKYSPETYKKIQENPLYKFEEAGFQGIIQGALRVYANWNPRVQTFLDKELEATGKKSDVEIAGNTVGNVIGTIGSFVLGGEAVAALKFGKAALPATFAALGQTSLPADTPIEARARNLIVDTVSGTLLEYIKPLANLQKMGMFEKGAEYTKQLTKSMTILSAQTYLDARSVGASDEQAREMVKSSVLILLGLHGFMIAGKAGQYAVSSKFKEGSAVFTPDQARGAVVGSNLEGTKLGNAIMKASLEAEAMGKNIQIDMTAAKKSGIAKALRLETPNGIAVTKIEYVDATKQSKLGSAEKPTAPGEAVKPVQPEPPTSGGGAATETKIATVEKPAVEKAPVEVTNAIRVPESFKSDVEKKAFDKITEDPMGVISQYEKSFENEVSPDLALTLLSDYQGHNAGELSRASGTIKSIVYDDLLRTQQGIKNNTVLITAGGSGSGKTTGVQSDIPLKEKYPIVVDTTFSNNSAPKDIQKALDAGYKVHVAFTFRDPAQAWEDGALKRIGEEGRVVSEGYFLRSHLDAQKNIQKAYNKFKDNKNVSFAFIENVPEGTFPEIQFDKIAEHLYNKGELTRAITQATNKAYETGKITKSQYEAATQDRSELGAGYTEERIVRAEEKVPGEVQTGAESTIGSSVTPARPIYDFQSTQINLPGTLAEKIRNFAEQIPKDKLSIDEKDNRFGVEKEPHVTVLYGLDNKIKAEQIRDALKGADPVEITFGKTSLFDTNPKYDVLKIDVKSEGLEALNKKLQNEFDVPGQTFKDYKPHATIAYLKKGEGAAYVGDTTFEGEKVTLDSLAFSTNTGEMVDIPLGANSSVEFKVQKPKTSAVAGGGVEAKSAWSPNRNQAFGSDNLGFNPKNLNNPDSPEATEELGKIVKQSEIAEFLSKKLGVPIRRGKFRHGSAIGIYKPGSKVIRIKSGGLNTIFHEVAHYLDDTIGFSKGINPTEIENLVQEYGKPPADKTKRAKEAFAEYMRFKMTGQTEKIADWAPELDKTFNEKIKEMPDVESVINSATDDFKRWNSQPATAKILSHLSIGAQGKSPFTDRVIQSMHDLYTSALDDLHPLSEFSKLANKNLGKVEATKDPYILARNLRGWVGKADLFLNSGTFGKEFWVTDAKGKIKMNFTGKSYSEIMKPVEQKKALDDFRVFIVSQRIVNDLAPRGIKTGVALEDAKAALEELSKKHPEFEEIARERREFNDRLLEYAKENGVIGDEGLKKIREANKYHVPFYRVMEASGAKFLGKSKIAGNLGNPIKKIKGSEREIIDPLESDVKNVYAIVNAAERNNIGVAMANIAQQNFELGRLFEEVAKPMKPITVNVKEVMEKAVKGTDAEDLDIPEELAEAVVTLFRTTYATGPNMLNVNMGDKQKVFEVDSDLFNAIQGLNVEDVGIIMKILSAPAKLLRAGATLSPDFSVRNPLRDQFTAFAYSKYGFIPGVDLIRGMFELFKKGDTYNLWKAGGGEHAMMVSLDRTELQKGLDEVLKTPGLKDTVVDVVKNPLKVLQILSEIGEKGTRLGEMRNALARGANPIEAAHASRNITLDFSRIGSKTRAINAIVAFFNANIQGTDTMVRNFKNNPFSTLWKVLIGITLPSILLYFANRDDPRWKEIPQWQKNLFWIVLTKDHIWRIPKPFELGVLFGSVPERALEVMDTKDPEMFNELKNTIAGGFTPGMLPTALIPIIENITNYSFFMDRPIVSRGKENLPPGQQSGPYTTEVSKVLGEALGYSPAKIDNLVSGYSGGLGKYAQQGLDKILVGTGISNEPVEPAKKLDEMPVIKAFMIREPIGSGSESVNRVYNMYSKTNAQLTYVKQLVKEGQVDEARQYIKDHPDTLQSIPLTGAVDSFSLMNKSVDAIRASDKLSAEEKRKRIDAIGKLQTNLAKKTLEELKNLEK